MRRLAIALGVLVAAAGAPSLAQDGRAERRADGMERHLQRCPLSRPSAVACPSLRMGPRASLRFDRQERMRETRALYASIDASLAAGDCEGARTKAVDDGRHELAARIRRACKAAS